MEEKKVLAMYDVRGIQKYIFKTAKIIDAIGASAIVENIIQDALVDGIEKINAEGKQKIVAQTAWKSEEKALPYEKEDYDIQVLYIGGGNAFVMFKNRALCVDINKKMARYVIEHTYSLQLAVAIVEKTDNYSSDYKNLFEEMNKVKANMNSSAPLGALPVMKIQVKTGYPMIDEKDSTESAIKRKTGRQKRKDYDHVEKLLDSYTTKKGVDSTLAVVHIDGNNMGIRIRKLIKDETDYVAAVNTMRQISFQIDSSYKKVFEDMKDHFEKPENAKNKIKDKENNYLIMPVLTAGDDITYVCNGKIALATVEYFSKAISGCTLNGKTDDDSLKQYGFSVCAGIAYIGAHFPFHTAYEVAEECCDNAKDYAKEPRFKDGERIGNWVDFQICKNIHAKNLQETRRREYRTASGENLLKRPYFIECMESDKKDFSKACEGIHSYAAFKNGIIYFQDSENIPTSFVKDMRNTYSLGENQMNLLKSFLDSRGWKIPEGRLYDTDGSEKVAAWYDALEMTELYVDLDNVNEG